MIVAIRARTVKIFVIRSSTTVAAIPIVRYAAIGRCTAVGAMVGTIAAGRCEPKGGDGCLIAVVVAVMLALEYCSTGVHIGMVSTRFAVVLVGMIILRGFGRA